MGKKELTYDVVPPSPPSLYFWGMLIFAIIVALGAYLAFFEGGRIGAIGGVFAYLFGLLFLLMLFAYLLDRRISRITYEINLSKKTIRRKLVFKDDLLTRIFEPLYDFGSSINLKNTSTIYMDKILSLKLVLKNPPRIYLAMERLGSLGTFSSYWSIQLPEGREQEIYDLLRANCPKAK